MSDDEDDIEQDYEEQASFVGCTCEHTDDQHGWGSCDVDNCPCEGGWEE